MIDSTTIYKGFLKEVERFLVEYKVPHTMFGLAVLNDPHFVNDLREGRKPALTTIERVQKWIGNFKKSRG
ncbi:MAG: hypothetical protein AB7Q04_13025 [Steroidobacteraceae bacterium]